MQARAARRLLRAGGARAALGLALALSASALGACSASAARTARSEVEAVFDMPREYRILSGMPCAQGAGLVYLVSRDAELYSFTPSTLAIQHIGSLDCPAPPGVGPNSMAVDRSGTAWLSYNDGSLFRASTRDAHCSATSYRPKQHGFGRFGMAFASSGPDLSEETLYIWGGYGTSSYGSYDEDHPFEQRWPDDEGWTGDPDSGELDDPWARQPPRRDPWADGDRWGDPEPRREPPRRRPAPRPRPRPRPDPEAAPPRKGAHRVRPGYGLGRVDLHANRLIQIGDDGSRLGSEWADLTGTGDGRVFGFFSTSPAMFAEIDPATGAILSQRALRGISTGQGWAFSFWGGDFYFYYSPSGGSNVSRLSADGSVTVLLQDVGFVIVGAGVSTCAPTGPT